MTSSNIVLQCAVLMPAAIALAQAAVTLATVVVIRRLQRASDGHQTALEALQRTAEVLTRRCDLASRQSCQQRLRKERRQIRGVTSCK